MASSTQLKLAHEAQSCAKLTDVMPFALERRSQWVGRRNLPWLLTHSKRNTR